MNTEDVHGVEVDMLLIDDLFKDMYSPLRVYSLQLLKEVASHTALFDVAVREASLQLITHGKGQVNVTGSKVVEERCWLL